MDLNFYKELGTNLINKGLKGTSGTEDHGQIGTKLDNELNQLTAETQEVDEEKKEVRSESKKIFLITKNGFVVGIHHFLTLSYHIDALI